MFILSLDPSLTSTGYAIIDSGYDVIVTKGKINPPDNIKNSVDDRIQFIIRTLERLDKPDAVILEDGYVGFNAQGSLKLAELRGALIAYYKYKGFNVVHQQPKEIRKHFGLSGAAKKEEVAKKVLEKYPNLETEIGPYSDKANKQKTSDIYDAISIGLSYIMQMRE